MGPLVKAPEIKPWMTIQEVIDQVPGAAKNLCSLGMACVGCTIARFETIAEVAQSYAEDPDELISALSGSVSNEQREIRNDDGT